MTLRCHLCSFPFKAIDAIEVDYMKLCKDTDGCRRRAIQQRITLETRLDHAEEAYGELLKRVEDGSEN